MPNKIYTIAQLERIAAMWEEGKSCDEIRAVVGGTQPVTAARRALGQQRVPPRSTHVGRNCQPIAEWMYEVERLWRNGMSYYDIDVAVKQSCAVERARDKLGRERIPIRFAHPKGSGKHPAGSNPLIGSRDLNRHLLRSLGNGEYVVRDENFREELWREDPHGIVFRNQRRLSFVTIMGMTERRVPDDLKHIYPA